MKKFLMTLAAGLVVLAANSSTVVAQGGGGAGRGMGGPRMLEMMMQGITLTDAQKAQVDSIVAKYQKEMPAFTPGTPPSPEDREKRMALMQKQNADIKAVLTDEQKVVFDKNQETMRQRRPGDR